MFCWPSRRGSRKKSQFEFSGEDASTISGVSALPGGGGILVKPQKGRKKGKKCSATFKCDLSEALLPPSDECLLSLRSASCNSSIRELSGVYQRNPSCGNGAGVRGSNKHFVSSTQHIPRFPREVDSDSVNNNNRSAEVLLFYSNNSLSTRNSLADFIENDEFNYKSLWGKDISEWDSRESRCNTLERETNRENQADYYVNSGEANNKVKTAGNVGGANVSNQKDHRLSTASSSPSLTIPSNQNSNKSSRCKTKSFATTSGVFDDDDDEPLPSPPPTPPEAKISLSTDSSLGTCSYFKYPQLESDKLKKPTPFRIHSSTSTSSLSSSCILTPEILDKENNNLLLSGSECGQNKGFAESGTQTLPFWQLEFPGILHCSCSRTSEDSGIVLNNSEIQQEDSTTISTGGHESPGGDSSSGISSDDNLESLHADEEIMLKSLKNSFLHQAIPFQLCNFSINGSSSSSGCKDKTKNSSGSGGCTNVSSSHDGQPVLVPLSSKSDKLKLNHHEHKNFKNQHHQHKKDKCELSAENISVPVTSQDRNRLGPVGKNYASSGLDANANESETPLLRGHGQTNGDLETSGKSCTKVAGSAEPHIDASNTTSNTSNLIINKSKSSSNRVSSNNQQNIHNSVLLQENSSLKEEVSRLSTVVSDLQEQISRLNTSEEETRQTLRGCLLKADTKTVALSIVAQQCDKERVGVYEQLLQQQAENNVWKQRLDEKLAELQQLQLEYQKEREQSQEDVRSMLGRHELEVDVTVRNCENKLDQVQKRHDETLAELKRSHTDELERIQETQRQELEVSLQKHRELLDEHRNKSPHDILHKEVESLQVVVEMRNEEIRELRKDLMDYKNTLNDLQMAREHAKSLVAKIEDLEAQLEKARADKRSLQERYQMLETNLQQIESENSRLVRCNDELNWKIKSCNLVEN